MNTTEEALTTLRGVLEGRIRWEGVGPKPWWNPFSLIEAKLEQNGVTIDALAAELERVKENRWQRMEAAEAELERVKAKRDKALAALRRVKENAESWHGPIPLQRESGPHQGHAAALAVIAEWCDAAIAEIEGEAQAVPPPPDPKLISQVTRNRGSHHPEIEGEA